MHLSQFNFELASALLLTFSFVLKPPNSWQATLLQLATSSTRNLSARRLCRKWKLSAGFLGRIAMKQQARILDKSLASTIPVLTQ